AVVGQPIQPGEGISGRAIVARDVVVADRLERRQFPKAVAKVKLPDVMGAMSAPMVVAEEIAGTVTWLRGDLSAPFTVQEKEFAVILDGASRDEAMGIAEQVRAAFSKQSVDTGTGQRLTSTVSAGCSTLDAWEVEGVLLLERADVALAMAKAGGRDQVVAA